MGRIIYTQKPSYSSQEGGGTTEKSFPEQEDQNGDEGEYTPYICYKQLMEESMTSESKGEFESSTEPHGQKIHPIRREKFHNEIQEDELEGGMTLNEAFLRIRILEDVCGHLNNQMKIMKKLISAQVSDIKKTTEEQNKVTKSELHNQETYFRNRVSFLEKKLENFIQQSNERYLEDKRMFSPIGPIRQNSTSRLFTQEATMAPKSGYKNQVTTPINPFRTPRKSSSIPAMSSDSQVEEIINTDEPQALLTDTNKPPRCTVSLGQFQKRQSEVPTLNTHENSSQPQSSGKLSISESGDGNESPKSNSRIEQIRKRHLKERKAENKTSKTEDNLLNSELEREKELVSQEEEIESFHLEVERERKLSLIPKTPTIDPKRMSRDPFYVIETYRPILLDIYNFYCKIYGGYTKGRVSLNKTQFMKFYRDCGLSVALKETSYELMWTKILRECGLVKSNHASEANGKELAEKHFERAIVLIANKIYKKSPSYSEAQKVESFLISHVVPNLTPLLETAQLQEESNQLTKGGAIISSNTNAEFSDDDMKGMVDLILKKFKKELQVLFRKFATIKRGRVLKTSINLKTNNSGFNTSDCGMSMKSLMELCQENGILRLITKKDLAAIYSSRALAQDEPKFCPKKEDTLTYESFEKALIDIANTVYSSPPFKTHYPTLPSRLEKLLTKIFVLSDRAVSSTTGASNMLFKESFRTQ